MSEFGNETSTAVLRTGEKSIEALMKLFKFLLDRKERKMNAELKKEQLNEIKVKSNERISKLKLEGKVGFVKAKLLQKSGVPLVAAKVTMTDQQIKDFSQLAKKYGIPFTSISDKNKTGEKEHTIFVREKDLATVKEITDRMNRNMHLKKIDEKISEINEKDTLSEQDKTDVEYLKQQKEDIINSDTKTFNEENAEIIFNDVCGEMQNKSLSFDKALNRFTDRDFSRDTPYYLCERTNPTSYVELKSTLDEFAGKEYTRTDYEVFKNEIEQIADLSLRKDGKFTDERFSGRPKGYWQKIKADMKEKGGFSDDVVVFNNKEEFLKYQQLYKEQQKEIVVLEKDEEYRDYATIIEQLKDQLGKNNAELDKDRNVIDKATQKPLTLNDVTSAEEKVRIAECIVISKQIENYNRLSSLEVKLAMDEQQLDTLEHGTGEYDDLNYEIKATQERIKNCLKIEEKQINERSQINGVQAATEVEKEYQVEHESLEKNERTEHEERKELDRETRTLDEWKGQISERREQITKNIPVDKSVERAVTSKDDR